MIAEIGDGVAGLRRATEVIHELERRRTEIIGELRRQGTSWEEIGRACGMTRQGATRRWARQVLALSFDSVAAAYERGRPSYPPAAVRWLVPGTARRVVELGAGTGQFTRLLVDAGFDVVAVEPAPRMRKLLATALPAVTALDGTAERIPLADGTADAVVVAQTWHWLDEALAQAEATRVLTPGGVLSLVWNVRDSTESWVRDLDEILHRHVRLVVDPRPALGPPFGDVEHRDVSWRHRTTPAELLDLVASRSYVIALPEEDRTTLLGEVRDLVTTHPALRDRAEVEVPYLARCTRARLLGP